MDKRDGIDDDIQVMFLAQGEQPARGVMDQLAAFIGGAQQSLDIATYDLALTGALLDRFLAALRDLKQAGVKIRVVYDPGKHADPHSFHQSESVTAQSFATLDVPKKPIFGQALMHHKYFVRDADTAAAAVWTGSLNLTADSFAHEDNNIVVLHSQEIAAQYEQDFDQLWQSGKIDGTGDVKTSNVTLRYGGAPATVCVRFSPANGQAINTDLASLISGATQRVLLCTMLVTTDELLNALGDVVNQGKVDLGGVYDWAQMQGPLNDWSAQKDWWKVDGFLRVAAGGNLVGKHSLPYQPGSPENFMHNKAAVIDDTVVTGSYNFSWDATSNAENVLFIENQPLAERYVAYINHLVEKYQPSTTVPILGQDGRQPANQSQQS